MRGVGIDFEFVAEDTDGNGSPGRSCPEIMAFFAA
jgi:hypothetical protein